MLSATFTVAAAERRAYRACTIAVDRTDRQTVALGDRPPINCGNFLRHCAQGGSESRPPRRACRQRYDARQLDCPMESLDVNGCGRLAVAAAAASADGGGVGAPVAASATV